MTESSFDVVSDTLLNNEKLWRIWCEHRDLEGFEILKTLSTPHNTVHEIRWWRK